MVNLLGSIAQFEREIMLGEGSGRHCKGGSRPSRLSVVRVFETDGGVI